MAGASAGGRNAATGNGDRGTASDGDHGTADSRTTGLGNSGPRTTGPPTTGPRTTGPRNSDQRNSGLRSSGRVAEVRAFNRFYTPVIGLLREGLYGSPYSLTEVRVIFELAQREDCETTALRNALGVDAGYLSRILARFESDGVITRERSKTDGRRQVVGLTAAGRRVFAGMEASSNEQVSELLAPIADRDQRRLLAAMTTIRQILNPPARSPAPQSPEAPERPAITLRPPQPGDLGWVIGRNGATYTQEYGWDETYEALVARIVADYAADHDPDREAAWIAEAGGERAGCVFCVRKDDGVAKLRLLLVEPWARGMGIGGRLVTECVDFAKRSGYREMVLWTQSILVDARRIYQQAGFERIDSEPHHSFGHDLVGETWRLSLT
jgi:DNA-binding MarR family transcriptional regulator/GNAT superfamily N-acetyltransferase